MQYVYVQLDLFLDTSQYNVYSPSSAQQWWIQRTCYDSRPTRCHTSHDCATSLQYPYMGSISSAARWPLCSVFMCCCIIYTSLITWLSLHIGDYWTDVLILFYWWNFALNYLIFDLTHCVFVIFWQHLKRKNLNLQNWFYISKTLIARHRWAV